MMQVVTIFSNLVQIAFRLSAFCVRFFSLFSLMLSSECKDCLALTESQAKQCLYLPL